MNKKLYMIKYPNKGVNLDILTVINKHIKDSEKD
jgi:hypothetical protein